MALRPVRHFTELIKKARVYDTEGDLEKAASLYEEAVRQEPLEELPYNRLMVIYRKLEQPKDELRIIDKALKIFQGHYDKIFDKKLEDNPKAAQLSRTLLKSLNSKTNKKTLPWYPEPVHKWIRRKKVVEKKLGK